MHNTTHTKEREEEEKTKRRKNSWDSRNTQFFFFGCFFMCLVLNLVEYKRVQNQEVEKERGFHDEQKASSPYYIHFIAKKTYIVHRVCKPVCVLVWDPANIMSYIQV